MATNNNNMLTVSQLANDLVAQFGYATTDYGFIANNSNGSVHMIWGITTPVGRLLKVPNGSVFFDVVLSSCFVKLKAGAAAGVTGATDGTWTKVS